MTGNDPDRSGELARALAPFLDSSADRSGALLAVSGGPDSTALLHAAAPFSAERPIFVATVDHRLRPEAATEAASVGLFAASLGLPHRVLVWTHPDHVSGIQAAARQARYGLLAAYAAQIGATRILTAHTADDQAETVLMRLIAGSGPAGLAGMAGGRMLDNGIGLARPFLPLSKADLVGYCEKHGLAFHVDPSNTDAQYGRARLRAILPVLAGEGLTPDKLRRLAERLARDDLALTQAADALFSTVARSGHDRVTMLDGIRLRSEPAALVLRVIDRALQIAAPPEARASFKRLERLERLVLNDVIPALVGGHRLRRTLRGVLVDVRADGDVRLSPAPPRRQPCRDTLVAGTPDLLGKGKPPAYIGRERVE